MHVCDATTTGLRLYRPSSHKSPAYSTVVLNAAAEALHCPKAVIAPSRVVAEIQAPNAGATVSFNQ